MIQIIIINTVRFDLANIESLPRYLRSYAYQILRTCSKHRLLLSRQIPSPSAFE